MRFKILLLSACLLLSGSLYAQTQEPDFIGEVYHMDAAGHATLLEKQHAVMKTKAGASLYLFGIGKVKTKINVKNGRSSTRFPAADTLRLVVKAVDNASDPMTIVQVFRFKASSKSRKAEVSSSGSFSGDSDNNLDYLPYTAAKYGESSYLLTLTGVGPGEYGIIVLNPNTEDEKNTIVSCFGID